MTPLKTFEGFDFKTPVIRAIACRFDETFNKMALRVEIWIVEE